MIERERYFQHIESAAQYIRERLGLEILPSTLIVTGTGITNIEEYFPIKNVIPYEDIPFFPSSTVESHKGELILGEKQDGNVIIMSGRWHYYEGYSTQEITLPIRVMKMLGVEEVIFTNVAGGVNPDYNTGDIIQVVDHIYTIPDNPLRGQNDDRLGVRFPDMLHTYDLEMRSAFKEIILKHGHEYKEGVYYCLQGPSLETPAEYNMIHHLGGDLVGMSTIPEVIVARHSSLSVSVLSIVSNVCYPPHRITETTIEEVIAVAKKTSDTLFGMIKEYCNK